MRQPIFKIAIGTIVAVVILAIFTPLYRAGMPPSPDGALRAKKDVLGMRDVAGYLFFPSVDHQLHFRQTSAL
jgi:hypothetical protein